MVSTIAEPLTNLDIPQPRPAAAPRWKEGPNVGEIERTASILAGSLLMTSGVKRFDLKGLAIAYAGYRLIKRGATGHCSIYKALHVTSEQPSDAPWNNSKTFTHPLHQHIRVEKVVTINKPVDEVYAFWRNLENFPTFMHHLKSVKVIDATRSHWVVNAPGSHTAEWDAAIVDEKPNQRIAWKSADNADVPNSGQVLFHAVPHGRGTEVRVLLAYDPPAGIFGELFAKLFGKDPARHIKEDLRHAKQILEAGEIPTIKGQPQGTCANAR